MRHNEMFVEHVIVGVLFVVTIILVCFGGYALYKSATTSGKVDYCYVDNVGGPTGGYQVIGHRPWRPDVHIGVAGNPQDTNEIIKNSVICPK